MIDWHSVHLLFHSCGLSHCVYLGVNWHLIKSSSSIHLRNIRSYFTLSSYHLIIVIMLSLDLYHQQQWHDELCLFLPFFCLTFLSSLAINVCLLLPFLWFIFPSPPDFYHFFLWFLWRCSNISLILIDFYFPTFTQNLIVIDHLFSPHSISF